jgi:F-type H+-transporting ATPase subunit delta
MLHRPGLYVSYHPIFAGLGPLREALRKRNSSKNSSGLASLSRGAWRARQQALTSRRKVASEEPIVSQMAGRYATALFELALDNKAVDAVKADLEKFDRLIAESPDFARLVRSPVFSAEQQAGALSAVMEKIGIGGLTAQFLNVVASNRRLFAVRDMVRGYRAMVARHHGEVTARVTVAEPLSDAHRAAIKEALNAVTGKDVGLDVKVDPAIIGGLVVQLGSRMVDSSLRTKLNSIKHAMKEVG